MSTANLGTAKVFLDAEDRKAKQRAVLRRKIACMVVQGLVAKGTFFHEDGTPQMGDADIAANVDLAYRYADAMLAREKVQP